MFNAEMYSISDKDKMKPIHELAPHPPLDGNNLVTKLWDDHHPSWRRRLKAEGTDSPSDWLAEIGALDASGEPKAASFPAMAPNDAIMRVRAVRKKKGSWWLVPENLRHR